VIPEADVKETQMKRRLFLKICVATGATGLTIGTGLLTPIPALAQDFDPSQAGSVDEVLKALGITATEPSDQIRIRAPSVAEDGATVPIGITSTIAGTTEIIALAAANPKPLAARYRFEKGATPAVEARLKMGKTTDVIAIVKAEGSYYTAKTEVKVTRGGCGG
jgi:sulfur-oxidizing protein SoxY